MANGDLRDIPVPNQPGRTIRVPSTFTPDDINAAIADYQANPPQPVVGQGNQEYMAPSPVTPSDVGRFALEAGGSIAATAAAPQIALPLRAARMLGPAFSRMLSSQLPKVMGSGAGGAGGSAASESFDPTADPLHTAGQAGKVGMMGEAGGQVLGKAAQWLGTPNVQPGVMQAQRLLGTKGAGLTSGQATKSGTIDVMENISESGFWGTKTTKMKESGERAANELVQDILNSYGSMGATREGGQAVQSAIQSRIGTWKAQGRTLYEQVDKLAGQKAIPVDILPIQKEAQRLADESILRDPTSAGLLKQILSQPRHLSFGDAQRLRSELLAVSGDPSELVRGQRSNYARLLARQIDSAMDSSATRLNPEAKVAWRNANAWWKGDNNIVGAGALQDPVIVKIMENDPGVVLDTLLKSGKLEGFTTAMKMLPPTVADGVRREFLERAVTGATESSLTRPESKLLGGRLAETTGVAKPYSNEAAAFRGLFGPQKAQELQDVVQTLRLTQTKSNDQGFTFVVRGMQIGGAMSAFTVQGGRYGLGITMLPNVAAWLINNPVSQRLLIHGVKLPSGTPEATATVMKLVAFAERNGIPVTGGSQTTEPNFAQRGMEGFKAHPRYQQGLPPAQSQPTPTLPLP